jgi:SAM-dependent methyltransferase
MFRFEDVYAAKFYFDRYRIDHNIWFNWHYNILEAVIKNAYIAQHVESFCKSKKINNVLDLGCGNGHVSQFLALSNQCLVNGFDPKITNKVRLINLKFNIKSKLHKNNGRTYLHKAKHIDFFLKNKLKFDVIIDNCSVTHFDTKKENAVNAGWNFIAKEIPRHLNKDGIFITATDVAHQKGLNSEFCFESDIKETFISNDWILGDIDYIDQPEDFKKISHHFKEFLSEDFLRVPPPGVLAGGALGIMGMTAKFRH